MDRAYPMMPVIASIFTNLDNASFQDNTYASLMSGGAHVVGWFGILLTFAAALILMRRDPANQGPLFIGWLLRVVFCIWNTYLVTFFVDTFEEQAAHLANFSVADIIANWSPGSWSYTVYCALIYKSIGRNPLVLEVINIAMWLAIQSIIPKMVSLLGGSVWGRRAAWLYALLPASVYFSTVILRESVCTLGIAFGSYYWLKASRHLTVKHFVASACWFGLATMFHQGCASMLLVLFAMPFLVGSGEAGSGGRALWFRIAMVICSLMICGMLLRSGFIGLSGGEVDASNVTALMTGETDINYTAGRTDYMTGLSGSSFASILLTSPIRYVFFVLSPLPWMISRTVDLFALSDAVFYWWMAYALFRARKLITGDRRMLTMLLLFFGGTFAFAMGTRNFGTAMRHRSKFFPVGIALACGAEELWKRRRQFSGMPQPFGEILPPMPGPRRFRRRLDPRG